LFASSWYIFLTSHLLFAVSSEGSDKLHLQCAPLAVCLEMKWSESEDDDSLSRNTEVNIHGI